MNITWIKIILLFVAISLPARCVGEWQQDRERAAYIEGYGALVRIPACYQAGMAVHFVVDRQGIVQYQCGR